VSGYIEKLERLERDTKVTTMVSNITYRPTTIRDGAVAKGSYTSMGICRIPHSSKETLAEVGAADFQSDLFSSAAALG
jgi:hypothetical protein